MDALSAADIRVALEEVRERYRDGTLSASAPLLFDFTTAQFCSLYVLRTSNAKRHKRALMHDRRQKAK